MSVTDHDDGKKVGPLGTLRMLSPTVTFMLVSFCLGELVRFILVCRDPDRGALWITYCFGL
jgi:hypothetical protein